MIFSETTFRLEALKFYEELFPDDSGFRDTSGWKCLYSMNFENRIGISDIKLFVGSVFGKLKLDKNKFDSNYIEEASKRIYNGYRFMMNENGMAFILKSKTVMKKTPEHCRFVRAFVLFSYYFKKMWNGTLEKIKIG